ncbi:hypothetical protein OKW45_005569 [Paraburkholderia sp. WSM4175]|uniref:hypothetical protein n=1 Tax=Paraburkholderia sp. WSM4175 TaxID=2991072 RepID=UPI003D2158DE
MAEVSIRKFARREGGSEGAVRKAIKAGRLAAPLAEGSLDPGLIRGVRLCDCRGPRYAPTPLLGLPIVVRRYEHPGGPRMYVGLIARADRDDAVDIVALPSADRHWRSSACRSSMVRPTMSAGWPRGWPDDNATTRVAWNIAGRTGGRHVVLAALHPKTLWPWT